MKEIPLSKEAIEQMLIILNEVDVFFKHIIKKDKQKIINHLNTQNFTYEDGETIQEKFDTFEHVEYSTLTNNQHARLRTMKIQLAMFIDDKMLDESMAQLKNKFLDNLLELYSELGLKAEDLINNIICLIRTLIDDGILSINENIVQH